MFESGTTPIYSGCQRDTPHRNVVNFCKTVDNIHIFSAILLFSLRLRPIIHSYSYPCIYMIQYIIGKNDLHELLRMLQILQPDEEIIMVNNIELRDPAQQQVSILVDTSTNKKVFEAPPADLTSKELETYHTNLMTLEKILLAEYGYLRRQLTGVRTELERRNINHTVSSEGIPREVDEHLSGELRRLLGDSDGNDLQE